MERLRRFILILLLPAAALLWGQPSFAAEPNSALPRSRDLQKAPESNRERPKRVPIQPIRPAPSKPAKNAGGKFLLKGIKIEGSRSYKQRDFYPIYRFFIGKKIAISDIKQIMARIDRFYSQKGWLSSRAILPQQKITNGVVRIRVFEGFIADVIVRGDAGLPSGTIKRELNTLKKGKPALRRKVESVMRRLQQYSYVRLRPSLRASPTKIGGVDLVVDVVSAKPYSGQFFVGNNSSETLGTWSAGLSAQAHFVNSTISTYLSSSIADPKRSFLARLGYDYKIGFTGASVGGHALYSVSKPQVPGSPPLNDKAIGLGLYLDLISVRTPTFNLNLRAAYDYSNRYTLNSSASDTGGISTNGTTNILTLSLNGGYRAPWASYTSFGFNLKQGLSQGDGVDNGNNRFRNVNEDLFVQSATGLTRLYEVYGRDPRVENFNRRATWITANLSHTQPLRVQDGIKPGISLFLSAQGQYAFDPLVNSETLAFGRGNIGRGFTGGRISGHHGWGVTTELRASWSHIGVFNGRSAIQDLTLYGFVDRAQSFGFHKAGLATIVSSFGTGVVQPRLKQELLSAGLGARVRWSQYYMDFYWARALNSPFREVQREKGDNEFIGRLHFLF